MRIKGSKVLPWPCHLGVNPEKGELGVSLATRNPHQMKAPLGNLGLFASMWLFPSPTVMELVGSFQEYLCFQLLSAFILFSILRGINL